MGTPAMATVAHGEQEESDDRALALNDHHHGHQVRQQHAKPDKQIHSRNLQY